jgi:glucosyl-dolichyl phosphate glucuronosyltransferase
MKISIVIATYNRSPLLAACLRSLANQSYERDDEVVVADNGSTDDTAGVVGEAAARWPVTLRMVYEPRPGKTHALAAALVGYRSDVFAFTDDDVVVAPDWLARIRAVMSSTRADVLGGRVLPRFAARVPDWLDLQDGTGFGRMASPLALLDYGKDRQPLGARTALGANMAVARRALLECGGFDASLGKMRGTLLSGEDHRLCERIQAAGGLAIYDPSVVVRHLVPPERLRLGYFLRWFFWSGVTHARFSASPADGPAAFGAPRYLFRQLGTSLASSAGAALTAGWPLAADHATRAMFAAGYLWTAWSRRSRYTAGKASGTRAEAV